MSDAKQIRSNKIKLLILILIPFLLMALAWIVFYTGIGMPSGTANKGELINPPIQINEMVVPGAEVIVDRSNQKWFFLLPGGASCDEACKQRLYLSRQIRTALGKYTEKITRLYLIDHQQQPDEELAALLNSEHEDLRLQPISRAAMDKLLAAHSEAANSTPDKDFYIADFRGFMMMYYTPQHSYKDTITDMKFLLKYAP